MSESNPSQPGFTLPQPGPHHAFLKPFEGTFRSEVKMWMGPGEPSISTGTMVNRWVLDGLFLQQEYTGDETGAPFPVFRGHGFWGYNSVRDRYEGFWIDNVSDQFQTETGEVDDSGTRWEMHSEFISPQMGPMQKRAVFHIVDENHHVMETWHSVPGQDEFKTMEIHFHRTA